MTVMKLEFKGLTLDMQQYEWVHQPIINNSKMQELVYGTSKEEIMDKMGNFTQQFWNFVEEFRSIGSRWILSYIKQANLKIFDFALIFDSILPVPTKSRISMRVSMWRIMMRNALNGPSLLHCTWRI